MSARRIDMPRRSSLARSGLRALALTFVVFCFEATLALLASFPLAAELGARLARFTQDPAARAAALDPASAHELLALGRGFARAHGVAALVVLLCSPWLQMSWFVALSEPQPALRALGRGARFVPRAVLISLALGLIAMLGCAPFLASAYALLGWLADDPNARRADLTTLAALLPLLPLAFYFHVAHDLARAAALDRRTFASVFAALRRALDPRVTLPALGLWALGLAVVALAHALSWPLRASLAGLVLQGALFVRLLLRAAWLSRALSSMHAGVAPLARTT